MLTDYQKMTIRRAVALAPNKDAEIRKLAHGMRVSEEEVRMSLADELPREPEAADPASSQEPQRRRGRPKTFDKVNPPSVMDPSQTAPVEPCPEEFASHGSPFDLIGSLLTILDLLRKEFQASILTISSNPSRGWATIKFEAGGENVLLALKRPRSGRNKA